MMAIAGGDKKSQAELYNFVIRAAELEGTIYVVDHSEKEFAGVGIFFGPGAELFRCVDRKVVLCCDVRYYAVKLNARCPQNSLIRFHPRQRVGGSML